MSEPIWIGFACDEESRTILITGLSTSLSRAEALVENKRRVDAKFEVTVIDFGITFEKMSKSLVSFLLDCGWPSKDITGTINTIGKEMERMIVDHDSGRQSARRPRRDVYNARGNLRRDSGRGPVDTPLARKQRALADFEGLDT